MKMIENIFNKYQFSVIILKWIFEYIYLFINNKPVLQSILQNLVFLFAFLDDPKIQQKINIAAEI